MRVTSSFIAEAEAGEGHRLLGGCYMVRAMIRHARGDLDGALADCERSAQLTDETDPTEGYALAMRGRVLFESGRLDDAIAIADTILRLGREAPHATTNVDPSLAFLLHALGKGEELLTLLTSATDTPMLRACRLWASGDIRGAADVFASLELVRFGEAFARLVAGRQFVADERRAEAEVELQRAIELFEPLGAYRYLAEANALLSLPRATAQRS